MYVCHIVLTYHDARTHA